MSRTKLRDLLFSTFLIFAAAPLTFGQQDTIKRPGSKDQSTKPAPVLSPKSSVPVNRSDAPKVEQGGGAAAPVLSPKSSVPVERNTETAGPNREKPVPVLSPKSSVPVEQGRRPAQDTNAKHHEHGK